MCGITSFLSPQRDINEQTLPTLVTRMGDSLRHRGPDDSGTWADAEAGIALGFRRLAILDLSPTGRQAMHSADDRYAMIFNGEVYNFGELRDELKRLGLRDCFLKTFWDTDSTDLPVLHAQTGCTEHHGKTPEKAALFRVFREIRAQHCVYKKESNKDLRNTL